MNKIGMSAQTIVLIILGLSFFGYILLNNIYTTYDSFKLKAGTGDSDYQCNNNLIILKETEISKLGIEFRPDAQTRCMQICRGESDKWKNYFKEKEAVYCNGNNEPICECKSSVLSVYIFPLF